MNESNPPPAVQQFSEAIYVLLKTHTGHSRSLFSYIRRMLWQYNLDKQFTETDIFIEGYVRGVQYLLKSGGETIRKPSAWMRRTILNVIREKSRERQRFTPLTWEVESKGTADESKSEFDEECFVAVIQAFLNLDHDNRKIIQLRFFESKSWQEVKEKIGEPDLTISALRKRGQRALKRLRFEYHQIIPSDLEDSE